jgi:GT2 family glycosyltransferase
VLRKGYRLLYVPRAVVYHRVLGEGEGGLKLYYSVRNRLLLIDTAFRGPVRHVARLYFLAAIASKLAVWSVTRRPFFEAARAGLADHRRGLFGEGRGCGSARRRVSGRDIARAGDRGRSQCTATINWNKYDDTVACVQSLRTSEYPLARILVLDNGSTDGSGERLERELRGPDLEVLRNPRNQGFAGGMNACLREALASGADLVFVVNNDTEVDPSCVRLLVEALDADPGAVVAGPAIFFHAQPDRVWQGGGAFSYWRAGLSVPGKGRRAGDLPERAERVSFLTWCAVLVSRRALEGVGFLDPDYYFYVEDVDFGLRVREAGMYMVFEPRARVWHKIGDVARDRTSPFVLYHIGRSSTLLFRQRFRGPYAWYGIALQYLLYTPHRLWQMLRGGAPVRSYGAWFQGLLDGAQRELRAFSRSSTSTRCRAPGSACPGCGPGPERHLARKRPPIRAPDRARAVLEVKQHAPGLVDDLESQPRRGEAKVEVLALFLVALVEPAEASEELPPDEQAGARDTGQEERGVRPRGVGGRAPAGMPSDVPVGFLGGDLHAGMLEGAVVEEKLRPYDSHAGAAHRGQERRQPAGCGPGVVVQEEEKLAQARRESLLLFAKWYRSRNCLDVRRKCDRARERGSDEPVSPTGSGPARVWWSRR